MEVLIVKNLPDKVLYTSLNHLSSEIERNFSHFRSNHKIKFYNRVLRQMTLLNLVVKELRERSLDFKFPSIIRQIYNSS